MQGAPASGRAAPAGVCFSAMDCFQVLGVRHHGLQPCRAVTPEMQPSRRMCSLHQGLCSALSLLCEDLQMNHLGMLQLDAAPSMITPDWVATTPFDDFLSQPHPYPCTTTAIAQWTDSTSLHVRKKGMTQKKPGSDTRSLAKRMLIYSRMLWCLKVRR